MACCFTFTLLRVRGAFFSLPFPDHIGDVSFSIADSASCFVFAISVGQVVFFFPFVDFFGSREASLLNTLFRFTGDFLLGMLDAFLVLEFFYTAKHVKTKTTLRQENLKITRRGVT
jgi:hypothetical protein